MTLLLVCGMAPLESKSPMTNSRRLTPAAIAFVEVFRRA
jgi:hypothetical protein